jgi:hypothetical protein
VAAGVAGDAADLLDDQQQAVVVAVQADFAHLLHVAGCLALLPQFTARTRPVYGKAGFRRLRQGFAVHPGLGQQAAGTRRPARSSRDSSWHSGLLLVGGTIADAIAFFHQSGLRDAHG